ncbi:MAG: tetratricopeptide repeat protein [Phycisphaerales bacterium]|nr:MAG: tetratricopeptide repeat protein [Phycisphaerales bacterium]
MDTPSVPDVLDQAIRQCQEGEPESALRLLRGLDREALSDPEKDRGRALGVEVACLIELDREGEAESKIAEALSQRRDETRFVLWLGNQLSDLGHFEPAERVLRALCELDPESPLPFYNLGVMLERSWRLDEATTAFDEALDRDASFEDALINKALCLEQRQDWEGAAQAYRRYLELTPDDAHCWVSLAIVESERDEYEQAYEAYEHALELEPECVSLHFNWAVTSLRRNDHEQLRCCASALARIAPGDWRTESVGGDVLEADGHIWPAWEAKLRAVEMAFQTEGEEAEALPAIAAVIGALRFAIRNDLAQHTEDLIEKVFDAHLFADGVLAEMRALLGEPSEQARVFFVQLEGSPHIHLLESEGDSALDPLQEYGYFRSCEVLANDEAQARRLALEFESRIGDGQDCRIVEIEEMEGPRKTHLGLRSCSAMLIFPVDEQSPEDRRRSGG